MAGCREAVAELVVLRKELKTYKKGSEESERLIVIMEQRISRLDQTIVHLRAALDTGQQIQGVDQKLLDNWQKSLSDAEATIKKLETQKAFWKTIGTGAGVGLLVSVIAIIGLLAGRK